MKVRKEKWFIILYSKLISEMHLSEIYNIITHDISPVLEMH